VGTELFDTSSIARFSRMARRQSGPVGPRTISATMRCCAAEMDNLNNGHVIIVHQPTGNSICHGVDRLDFVKINAEGAEAQIIQGMNEPCKRMMPSA
jgi:hypothetical protein